MKIIKFLLLFGTATLLIKPRGLAQANPTISVLPANAGLVAVGATLDLQIDIGNTGLGTIAVAKLRPNIAVPASVTFLPDVDQTGLPAGWTILSNSGSQLRFCNTSFVVPAQSSTTIILKVRGVTITPSQTFSGQINFGNGSTCAAGPTVSGNNTADDNATSTIEVVPGCSLGINATAGTILCNNGTTSITATATAATGPVEYSITGTAPFLPGNIFNNVAAGAYNVTVREVNNPTTCIISSILNITSPPAIPSPAVNITQPTCLNPYAVVMLTTGTNDLNFSVDGGSFTSYPAGGFLLPAGSHSIVAKNVNDCTSPTTTFIVNEQPATPQTPTFGNVTQPDCTNNTGSVVLNNLPAGTWIIEPGNSNGTTTSTTIHNLAPGSYSFTVTNALGCTSIATSSVNIIAVAGAPEAPMVTLIQPTCTNATGAIIITSPTAGMVFSLDVGAFAPYPNSGYAGIITGSHTLVAQNISGCLSPATNITINNQPASPTAPTVNVQQPNCSAGTTGTITVTSPTADFTFSFDGSPFAPYPPGGYITTTGVHMLAVQNLSGCTPNLTPNIVVNAQPATPAVSSVFTPITCFTASSVLTISAAGGVLPYEYRINAGAFQNENNFTVGVGLYSVEVKDANGCIGGSSITITQPTAISATATAATITCNGGSTTLTVTASGGLGTYEYSINNGSYQLNNKFSVTAGTYDVNVRLANNPACSAAIHTTINVSQPNILKASATAKAIEFCGGNSLINVTGIGGTPPYNGIGSFVKGPGNFNFIVVDANGCISSTDLIIFPPGCVDIKIFPNPAQDLITVNHSAAIGTSSHLQIFSENGVKVFTQYVPQNNFISTLKISSLSSGNYVMVYINGDEKKATKFIKTTN